jgi:uncharacterized membrane protein YbhN (UPF0104 family)
MSTNRKQLIKLLIRISVTTILLIWVFSQINFQRFWQSTKNIKWEFLAVLWILTVVIFWIRSAALQYILKKQDCNVSVGMVFSASAITSLYSMILPGILSTGAKWYILKKDTGKGTHVFSSMVYNQLSLMYVMAVSGLVGLIVFNPTAVILTNPQNRWILPTACGILLVFILLITFLLFNRRTGSKVIASFEFLLKRLPGKISRKSQEVLEQIAVFQTVGWRFHLIVVIIAVIGTLIGGILTYVFAAKCANTTVSLSIFVWLCPIVYLLRRLPISIASLGVREVTLIGVLGIYGVEKSAALLISMILFSSSILMALIGAVYHILWAARIKKNHSKGDQTWIE